MWRRVRRRARFWRRPGHIPGRAQVRVAAVAPARRKMVCHQPPRGKPPAFGTRPKTALQPLEACSVRKEHLPCPRMLADGEQAGLVAPHILCSSHGRLIWRHGQLVIVKQEGASALAAFASVLAIAVRVCRVAVDHPVCTALAETRLQHAVHLVRRAETADLSLEVVVRIGLTPDTGCTMTATFQVHNL